VANGTYTAKVRQTGKQIDPPVVLTFKLQDGKIARHMVLGDTAALEASYTRAAGAAS
jgi:ketosteroid isomerase-like protein